MAPKKEAYWFSFFNVTTNTEDKKQFCWVNSSDFFRHVFVDTRNDNLQSASFVYWPERDLNLWFQSYYKPSN